MPAGRHDLVGANAPGELLVDALALVEHRHSSPRSSSVARRYRSLVNAGISGSAPGAWERFSRAMRINESYSGTASSGGADGEEQRQRVEGQFLDLDVVALEQQLLQVVDGIAAARDVDRHLGGVEPDASCAPRPQQIVELQDAEHAR